MAVKTNITINIVEPGSDVPVPDTGLFTHGIGNAETTIIVSAALVTVLVILSIVLTTYMYRKHKKQGRTTKLVHIIDQTKAVVKSKKRITIGLSIIALLVSACTFTAFMLNTNNSNTSAIEGNDTEQQSGNTEQSENTNNLTINAESKDLTIEVKDQPVFAVLPVQVTVEEATQAGYTLTAYTDNTDLVSTTNPNNKIPMVTVEGDELTSLQDNTWGLALDNEPEAKDQTIYTALSTDQTNPTLITDKDYEETEANDTTTIYYGFYITPGIPYGTYTSATVNYVAEEPSVAIVTYDGNGLYFNDDEKQDTNVVVYEHGVTDSTIAYSHTPNVNGSGEFTDYYPINSSGTYIYDFANATTVNINLVKSGNDSCCGPDNDDYFTFWSGSYPEYTAADYTKDSVHAFGNETGKYVFDSRYTSSGTSLADTSSVTFAYATSDRRGSSTGSTYGLGYYASITAIDSDGQPAHVIGNAELIGEYKTPTTTTIQNYMFLGWSTDPNATFASYINADDIATGLLLDVGDRVTLYAVWSPIVDVAYNGNNATIGGMESISYDGSTPTIVTLEHKDVIAGNTIDLYAPNYKKTGYGFAGWSTDRDAWNNLTDVNEGNNPVIYGPNETVSVTKDMALEVADSEMILYAVWIPVEQNNGTPVTLQGWNGCTNLTPTTYDAETGKLSVGTNTLTALMDDRDDEVYSVARLADGNCWLIENLRLDNDAVITTTNTNNPVTVNGNVAIKNNDGNTYNHLSASDSSWCRGNSNAQCIDQSYLNTFNTNLGGEGVIANYNGKSDGQRAYEWYSYGNYYNEYSATAGNGEYKISGQGLEVIAGDICPTGWQLPYGGSGDRGGDDRGNTSGGFYYLGQHMGSDSWISFPNNFVYSGSWVGSYASNRGSLGYYWSSAHDKHDSYINVLEVNKNGYASVGVWASEDSGCTVRCVTLAQ